MKSQLHFCFGHTTSQIERIVRLEAARNYTWLHFVDGKKTISSYTLAHLSLCLPQHFSRIHRTHCVNTLFIKSMSQNPINEVILTDGSRLPVARRRRKELMNHEL